ncbi:MAG: hypothetical protein ABIK79_17065 [Chloroflexota bacterium]
MSEMVPLPPEEKESERPGWVLPLAIVSAVLAVALVGYLAWNWVGGLPEGSSSLLSFLSRSPSSEAPIALTPVTIGATLRYSDLCGQERATIALTPVTIGATVRYSDLRGQERATIALTPVTIGATAAPTEGASLPMTTPSPTLKSPTATPTTIIAETPLSTETITVPEATDQPAEGEGTDEMPPTGIGMAYLILAAMALAVVLLLARVLRTRYQG